MMNISFYDALRVAEEVPSIGRSLSKVDGFVTFIQSLKSKAKAYSVSELLEEIIDLTGYVDELKADTSLQKDGTAHLFDKVLRSYDTLLSLLCVVGQCPLQQIQLPHIHS